MGRTVAVIGGGYGGAAVAKALDEDADVVLIEPKDAFVHAAGSLRALVQPDWAGNIFFPYDRLLQRGKVIRERAASVDPGGVTLASGERVNGDYLSDSLAAARTPQGQVRVTGTLNVDGHGHIYALGDITDLAEAKMAGYAMRHAEVVAKNIIAQVQGKQPTAVYQPSPIPSILLPLGPGGGVGQVPSPDGPTILPAQTVSEYKGADLFTGRFVELFGTA